MKILFIGDSLTKGQVGASFVNLLRNDYAHARFTNLGSNGHTWNAISSALLTHLQKVNDYDFIVVQGGANDILLPVFEQRGGLFALAYRSQIKKGMRPLKTPQEFQSALDTSFRQLQSVYKGRFIMLTLGCINEKLSATVNLQRRAYNDIIRKTAIEHGWFLADAALVFEAYLAQRRQQDYLIQSFWSVTVFDRLISSLRNGTMLLSKRRKLHITIDGVHLNTVGAQITRQCIHEVITNNVK